MNKTVTALLFLSVAVTASALAVRDQINERGLQTQDETNPSLYPHFPWGGDKSNENNNEANKISSDDIESVRKTLQALEQRNLDALLSAPKAHGTHCETTKEQSTTNDSEQVDTVDGKETDIAKLQSESLTTFRDVYKTKVVKAEKYELPALTSGENANSEIENVAAVIVTLTDGRRYAIAWGRGLWDDNSSAVLNADHVTNDWQLIESKDIQLSTVADYVQASDSSTSYGEAAEKMMKLD